METKAVIEIIGEVPLHYATMAIVEMEDICRKYFGTVTISKYSPKKRNY